MEKTSRNNSLVLAIGLRLPFCITFKDMHVLGLFACYAPGAARDKGCLPRYISGLAWRWQRAGTGCLWAKATSCQNEHRAGGTELSVLKFVTLHKSPGDNVSRRTTDGGAGAIGIPSANGVGA